MKWWGFREGCGGKTSGFVRNHVARMEDDTQYIKMPDS